MHEEGEEAIAAGSAINATEELEIIMYIIIVHLFKFVLTDHLYFSAVLLVGL
jgi:hypothetical protein